MKVEDSKYANAYLHKISKSFGIFYIYNSFVIAEIEEGVHFDWPKAIEVIENVYEYFGTREVKLTYISNRINEYSVNAQDWKKFYKERHHIEKIGIVAYTKIGVMNIAIEKIFTQSKIKSFKSLDKAILWCTKNTETPTTT